MARAEGSLNELMLQKLIESQSDTVERKETGEKKKAEAEEKKAKEKLANLSMTYANPKFTNTSDPVYMENMKLITEQERLWSTELSELKINVDEFNHVLKQMFQLNHIHVNPYNFGSLGY